MAARLATRHRKSTKARARVRRLAGGLLARGAITLLAALLLIIASGPCAAAPRVFVIHSYHSGLEWTDSVMDGIRKTFAGSGSDIQMSAEYLDTRRFVDARRSGIIKDAIIATLEGGSFDLVIACDNDALSFVLSERERLFPGVPVVFVGVNHFDPSMLKGHRDITGVAEEPSIAETVGLATRLHPGTTKIIVVGRTSMAADKANRDSFVAALPRLPPDLKIEFWDDLSLMELDKGLMKLRKGEVVFLNGLIMDEAGRQMMYGESTKWVRRRSAVPLYSFWDVYLGYGIVGGKLVSGYEQGRQGAVLALRILGGERPGSIPVVQASDVNRYMLDYRETERFRIPLSAVPKDVVFVNRPDSIYRSHREFILTTAAVILALSGLVILLGVTMIRRRRAEEALRQANLVVESSPAVLFRWKAAQGWPVELVSGNVTRFGYRQEELLSGRLAYAALVHPDDLARVKAEVDAYTASGAEDFEQEYRLVSRAGQVRWIYDRTSIEREPSGAVAAYQGIVMDVTERKEAERKLGEKTEELDRFFTVALDLLCIADMEGFFRRLNPQWEVVLGYPLSELEGRSFFELIHPDDRESTRQAVEELASQRAVTGFVNRYRCADGSYRWFEWRSYPVGDFIYAAARDITERRQTEEALKKSEEKYRDIFERAAEGIFQSTPEGRFLSVNPSFAQMLGYDSPDELVALVTDIGAQLYVHPEERLRFTGELESSASVIAGFEHEFYRKDGGIIWISTNARAVRDPGGRVLYFEGTSENITARKIAEREIHRLNEDLERRVEQRTTELQAANKELEAFSYSVSHDLRAPLRAIDGYARIIMEEYAPVLDAEGQRQCAVIQENVSRMGRLIDDLLAFSRLGRAGIEPVAVDMELTARSVFYEITTPEARERIEFTLNPLPPALADPALIRQVWVNLLSNAVKFSSKRDIAKIEVSAFPGATEHVYFVRDNGAGFDMNYKDKLFGVFQRLHSEREFEGTGAGLAIVRRIINLHGGRVRAEGAPDEGAEFSFTLPAERE